MKKPRWLRLPWGGSGDVSTPTSEQPAISDNDSVPLDLPPELASLAWLADAPLFLDSAQVSAFYDAVVRPEAATTQITLRARQLTGTKTGVGVKVGADVSTAAWLRTIFPFIDVRLKAEGEMKRETQREDERATEVILRPIDTPYRQLVQLALHYIANQEGRVRIITETQWDDASHFEDLLTDKYVRATPRALVFLDLPRQSRLIPTAAELDQGRVVTFYQELAKAFGAASPPDRYPERKPDQTLEAVRRDRHELYWNWYRTNFDPQAALEVVEKVIANHGRVQWMAYVVAAGDPSTPDVHLKLSGNGGYPTGTFAYNIIRKGYEYGLRIVGTLSSEPDISVLAAFEK